MGEGADGFVDGEGVGAIVLKPLNRAIEDGDSIYGVIKGSALNAGGKTNGYTVPNPIAQSEAIADALRRSGVHPRTISYLEAHGTGTALGDPIEFAGLKRAFSVYTKDTGFCALGIGEIEHRTLGRSGWYCGTNKDFTADETWCISSNLALRNGQSRNRF